MKAKKTTKKTKMTDAEIKEAIKRDKEWMDDIDSDEGIVVPKGALKDIFGDNDDDLNLLAKMRLARKWKVESGKWKAFSRMEDDLLYVSTAEGLQARLPFIVLD